MLQVFDMLCIYNIRTHYTQISSTNKNDIDDLIVGFSLANRCPFVSNSLDMSLCMNESAKSLRMLNYRQMLFPSVIFKILLFPRQCSIVPDFNLVNRPPVHETSTDAETAESEYIHIASNVLVGGSLGYTCRQ